MGRLIFKLFLNSHNALDVLAWMVGLLAAFLALRLALRVRRAYHLLGAERARRASLARWREMFGCDPRGLSSAERSALAPWVSQ